MEQQHPMEKQLKGYKIIVIVLAVVLAALTFFYVTQIGTLKDSRAILTDQRDTLRSQLSMMIVDLDGLRTENDTINANLEIERHKADSLMERIQQERRLSANQIRSLTAEMNTMRAAMTHYLYQIDSLNTLATSLARENVQIRSQINTERLRADMAEERAQELDVKVRKGSVILARGIQLLALNRNDREVTRASRASILRTDFTLTANELAQPGPREVYVRIIGPDGYVMANASNATIEIDGERLSYSASRPIDYDGSDLPVNVFYDGSGITAGKYSVTVYLDGQQIGSNEIILR